MIQDIITLTKKRDKHAPRKGEEAVTRMKKLSYYHNDEELWPDVQVYNVRASHHLDRCVMDEVTNKSAYRMVMHFFPSDMPLSFCVSFIKIALDQCNQQMFATFGSR